MPFKKRINKKKSYGGRKFNNAVRKVISKQTETKSLGQEEVEQVITSATVGFILAQTLNPAEGASPSQRIGDTIKGIGLYYNFILTSTVDDDQMVRIVFYTSAEDTFDAATDNLVMNIADDATSLGAEQIIDIGRSFNKNSCTVLSDKVYKLNATSATTGNKIILRRKLLKFNHKRVYDQATGESRINNIRCAIWNRSVDNDASTVTCEFTLLTKYYYQDY